MDFEDVGCEIVGSWTGRMCCNIATKHIDGKHVCTYHYNRFKL